MTKLKKIKIISGVLALMFIFSLALAACKDPNGPGNSGSNLLINNTSNFAVDGTVHQYNMTETEDYLVQNGASGYSIVISQNAPAQVVTAAVDFANYFLEATGVYLETEYAEQTTFAAGSKFIVIGENSVSAAAGLQAQASELGDQGFKIKTVNKSVFAYGASASGSQYAAYQLLTLLFNFDYFGVDCYCIDKGLSNVKLQNYDVTDVPDIGIRASNYQFLMNDKTTAQRMRLTSFGDIVIPVGGKTVHNSVEYISKKDYPDKTDWFSTDGSNLCYTAHGNASEMQQMQRIVADKIIECFVENPSKNLITMTHEDTQTLCSCPACSTMRTRYNGSQAASVVIFLNGVAEMVEEYFASPEGQEHDRDFRIMFFAYHATNTPPVKYNESKKTYEPIDDKVVLNDHLIPYFAETNGDYTKDFYDTESANAPYAENLRGWAAVSKRIYFWMYSTNFSHYLTPYNSFDSTQATYKYAIENKVDFIYDQGQSNQTGSATGWSWLKIYLYSKLTWNVNQDINVLIDKFMTNYFGPAADTMKQVFAEWKVWANYQSDVLGYEGARSIFYNARDAKLWSKQMLRSWTAKMSKALEEVEPLRSTDISLYNMYVKNISTERIAYNYLLLDLYQPTMTADDIAEIKAQFYHDQTLANIGRESERGGTVTQFMQKWGII